MERGVRAFLTLFFSLLFDKQAQNLAFAAGQTDTDRQMAELEYGARVKDCTDGKWLYRHTFKQVPGYSISTVYTVEKISG